jgi:hypothetical protein
MCIKYNESLLFELFESEPTIVGEDIVETLIYSRTNCDKFSFHLCFAVFECRCSFSLSFEDRLLFDTSLENVKSLIADSEKIRIQRSDSVRDYILFFEPHFMILTESTK